MAVTVTAKRVLEFTGDGPRPAGHAGWNNPVGDPDWIPDVDWYRRYQLEVVEDDPTKGVPTTANWEIFDGTIPFKTVDEIKALDDPSEGVFINVLSTWSVWTYTGINEAGKAYADTGTRCVATLRANGLRPVVLLGPARKYADLSNNPEHFTVYAFLPGAGSTPSGSVQVEIGGHGPTGINTGATPHTFTGGTSGHEVPPNLAALQSLGSLGQTTAWASGKYVVLGDASKASWNGTAWVVFVPPPPALASITVTPASATLASTTGTQQLTATPVPADAPLGTVSWTSSDTNKATVGGSTGLVTGVAAGQVTITAASGTARGTSTITVPAAAAPPPDGVPTGTVSDVLAWVGGDPWLAQVALDAEMEKANPRTTLMEQLQAIIDAEA